MTCDTFPGFWGFLPLHFPMLLLRRVLLPNVFRSLSLCPCTALRPVYLLLLRFGALYHALSLSFSVWFLLKFCSLGSSLSLCFVLHFSYHESRCEFLSLLCIFSSLFCVFCFFVDFRGLFLGQFPLFSSLPLLCCSLWLPGVKVILFHWHFWIVMHACVWFLTYCSQLQLHVFFSPVMYLWFFISFFFLLCWLSCFVFFSAPFVSQFAFASLFTLVTRSHGNTFSLTLVNSYAFLHLVSYPLFIVHTVKVLFFSLVYMCSS